MSRMYEDTSPFQFVREFQAPGEVIRAHLPSIGWSARSGRNPSNAVPIYVQAGDAFEFERAVWTAARSCRGIYAALQRARAA